MLLPVTGRIVIILTLRPEQSYRRVLEPPEKDLTRFFGHHALGEKSQNDEKNSKCRKKVQKMRKKSPNVEKKVEMLKKMSNCRGESENVAKKAKCREKS